MLFVDMISWWYGAGWRGRSLMIRERMAVTLDYFSIGLLFKTFFSPYREISAGKVNGSLDVKMKAFADRLISRCIGAMIRSVVLCIGLISITLQSVFGIVILFFWAFIPLLPLVGVSLMIIGWVPTWA